MIISQRLIHNQDTSIIMFDKEEYHYDRSIELEEYSRNKYNLNQIIDIMKNPKTIEIIDKIYKKEIIRTTIYFISNETGKAEMYRNIKSIHFIKMLDIVKPYLQQETIEKYNQILNNFYLNNYFEKHKNDVINMRIDNINYQIKFSDIITFLTASDELFEEYINSNIIFGIQTDHFIYTVKRYFETNNINNFHYIINDKIENRLHKLNHINTSYLNKITEIKDSNYENITINEEYKKYITENIPNNLSLLEKVVYIYIKMCKSLTYDEEFFAFNQQGDTIKKHQDPKHISEISLTNNRVVCYEFNAIFGKFLTELGINYETIRGTFKDRLRDHDVGYGKGHEYLRFRIDNKIYEADAVKSILKGDLGRAKINQPLEGLSTYDMSKSDISNITFKIYKIINEEEKTTFKEESFEELVEKYKKKTNNYKPVKLTDKLQIFIEKVNNSTLKGIDLISYMLYLKNILFTDKEQENNFGINIIRENIENTAKLKILITFRIPTKKTEYFFYKEGSGIIPLDKEEIISNFDKNNIQYITDDDPQIVGIRRR